MAEQVIQITNYGTAAGGKASGLQTFLLERKIAGGARFQTKGGKILSLLAEGGEQTKIR